MGPFRTLTFEGWNLEKQSKKSLEDCEINRDIVCYHMYHETLFRAVISQKLFLESVHARSFCLRGFSFRIYRSAIDAIMPKVRLLTNRDSMLGCTREVDEVFKKNS